MPATPTRWTPERFDREELLDLGHGSIGEVRRSLSDLDRINRWLGGRAPLRRFLFPRMTAAARRPLRVLDVGTGSAAGAVEIARWARRQGISTQLVALDRSGRHLSMAREAVRGFPEIRFTQADVFDLPFADESFDFVCSTLLLHHFAPAALRQLLPKLWRLSRGSVILNDLVRGRVPAWFFAASAPFFARSPLTKHDGHASIRRAYTPGEMRRILDEAGLSQARLYTHGLYYRMTIVMDRDTL
jgi:ubiquinone/menaquinone biosynthesis C-methylase UbiE